MKGNSFESILLFKNNKSISHIAIRINKNNKQTYREYKGDS